jgi:hypothetical protein
MPGTTVSRTGDIQVLGVASYTAPLLSTLILILFGYGEASIRHSGGVFADYRRRVPGRRGPAARKETETSCR